MSAWVWSRAVTFFIRVQLNLFCFALVPTRVLKSSLLKHQEYWSLPSDSEERVLTSRSVEVFPASVEWRGVKASIEGADLASACAPGTGACPSPRCGALVRVLPTW